MFIRDKAYIRIYTSQPILPRYTYSNIHNQDIHIEMYIKKRYYPLYKEAPLQIYLFSILHEVDDIAEEKKQ